MTTTDTPLRSRTYTWSDPMELLATSAGLDGLELLRGIAAGVIAPPPAVAALGAVDLVVVEPGRVVFTLEPGEHHYNPLGTVHGGVLATMLDTAAGCAVHSSLPAGTAYTSLDLATRFLRQVTVDSGTLRIEGTVLQLGRRTALAEAKVTDGTGRLVAHATSTCMIFRPEPGRAS